jgi:polysaccharide pyruvyl transferase WcaK-like protein
MSEQGMSKQVIEIIGPSFHNKGDYLMFIGIDQRLSSNYFVSIGIKSNAPYILKRAGIAIVRRSPRSIRRAKYHLAGLLPERLRFDWHFFNYNDISAVLDCSGFQYGDQWENLTIKNLWRADHYNKLRKQGKKIVMMPQALGPFEKKEVREAMMQILDNVDLVFARDSISYEHLKGLDHKSSILRQSPDFTNLVTGTRPKDPEYWKDKVCIVPNGRMLDKTPPDISQNYFPFLTKCIDRIVNFGLKPVILIHETYDNAIGRELQKKVDHDVPLVDENPLDTKGILGSCHAVISSRYHAIIGSMSQSVPTLGTGWAHKYKILYDEYGCPECLLQTLKHDTDIDDKLTIILDKNTRKPLEEKLSKNAEILKEKSRNMWKEVESTISS